MGLPILLQIPQVESIFTCFFTLNKEAFSQLNIDNLSREYIPASSLVIPLAFFTSCFIYHNYRIKYSSDHYLFRLYEKVLDKSETPIRSKLLNYYRDDSTFLLTLKNNKVYVGNLTALPAIYSDTDSIAFIPKVSGYRDEKSRFEITTSYAPFYENTEQNQNSRLPHWPQVVVKYEEVVSIQSFSLEDYKKYFKKDPVEEKDEDKEEQLSFLFG